MLRRLNVVGVHDISDQGKFLLKVLHELSELIQLLKLLIKAAIMLNHLFTKGHMAKQGYIEASNEHHESEMDYMQDITDDIHPKLMLNKIHFILVKVLVYTLFAARWTFIPLAVNLVLYLDIIDLLLVELLHVFAKEVLVDEVPVAGKERGYCIEIISLVVHQAEPGLLTGHCWRHAIVEQSLALL